jgi:hypothetical protein
MKTLFNINEEVSITATIKSISIIANPSTGKSEILYRISVKDCSGDTCEFTVHEEELGA